MTQSIPQAFEPLAIGPLKLRNRFIKAATNEGMCKKGIISKGLAQFHAGIAQGGAALTTVAYCATSLDGRTFVDQAVLNEANVADFRALTDGVHAHGGAVCAQVTHAGCFTFLSHDDLQTSRPLSASGGFNKVGVLSRRFTKKRMTQSDMAAMTEEFVQACVLARESGFDAVELHMGHGYLLSQFVSPLYNKRRDAYGGNIAKRMKFPAEVLSRVLDAVGNDLAVIVKYSITDGVKAGNGIEEGIEVARILERTGAHMAVLSNGMNVESVSGIFGSSLPSEVRKPPENWVIRLGMRMQHMADFKPVTFREMYLLENSKRIREAVQMPLAYLGGVQNVGNVRSALDAGFDAVALGRVLVHDANLIEGWRNGTADASGCTACNHCVTMMYSPAGTACIERMDGASSKAAAQANLIAASA